MTMPYRTTPSKRDSFCFTRPPRWAAVACFTQVVWAALSVSSPALGEEPVFWRAKTFPAHLNAHLPLLGHRNWIVVADSAYPWQSRPGIQTVYIHHDHVEVVEAVLGAVDASKHLRGIVHIDAELRYVPEEDAPGVEAYRKRLAGLLKKQPVKAMPHEEVIAKLDEAAKTFRVLIIKTKMAIPYTSVFIQLDCGYWGAEQEKRLREAIDAKAR